MGIAEDQLERTIIDVLTTKASYDPGIGLTHDALWVMCGRPVGDLSYEFDRLVIALAKSGRVIQGSVSGRATYRISNPP